MILCPNGPYLFIGTQEGILTLVKLEEHEYAEKYVMIGSQNPSCVEYDVEKRTFLSCNKNGNISFWNT